MKRLTRKQIEFMKYLTKAQFEFLRQLFVTFTTAYRANANGKSKEAILILHDIIAANNSDKKIAADLAMHRIAITTAIECRENGIPLPEARKALADTIWEGLQ